jgi:glycine/D-amino acid oxidase-like deaminating enzyme
MWDFAVIGGGIAGLTAAAHLAPLGSVVLLEAEATTGYHASGRSAALYEADYGAPATVALARWSLPALRRLEVLAPRGLMLVGLAGQESAFEADRAMMRMHEIPLAEAQARVPILNPATVARTALSDRAQDLDTDRLMQAYGRSLRAAGGALRTRAPVTGLRRVATGWEIVAGGEGLRARQIVNAAGAWADRVAQLAGLPPLGIVPYRRSIAQIPAPAGQDTRAWPMLIGVGEAWYAKPAGGRLLVSPADEHPMAPHDAWADDEVLAEGIARYEAAVTEPVTRVERRWAGLRSFAPDRALVLGPDPLEPAFWWCAGQGGQGFQSAPGAGAVLAERAGGPATGLPAEVIAALAPDRFRKPA